MHPNLLVPNWPAAEHVKAYTTLREGGFSTHNFSSFNLADHVGDNPKHVEMNRQKLKNLLKLTSEPIWLQQVHSTKAVEAIPGNTLIQADASYAFSSDQICVVLTADCLPVLICDKKGSKIAAIHAGWKGLADGIIESTLLKLEANPDELLVWLGPAIGPQQFEVGADVHDAFISAFPSSIAAFTLIKPDKWLGDLYAIAKLRLQKSGIQSIYGGEYCTYSNHKKFYSYRRDKDKTGRMATLIWISKEARDA